MTVMRWFRRNNKKLMVGIVFVVMIAFGLPTVLFRGGGGGRDPAKQVVAYANKLTGDRGKITVAMIRQADRDLKVLMSLGVDRMAFEMGAFMRIRELAGIGQYPVLMSHLLFFSEGPTNQMARQYFYARAHDSSWASDQAAREKLLDEIDRLAEVDTSQASLYYYLLSSEARHHGIRAGDHQIDALLAERIRLIQAGKLPAIRLQNALNTYGMTHDDLRRALGNYLSILLYGQMATGPMALSEPQLKKIVRDDIDMQNVSGTFVSFGAGLYADNIAEPTEQQLEGHFESYKHYVAGEVADENPYGLGYMLGSRVQVEYLRVALGQTRAVAEAELQALGVKEQEQRIQQYWQSHRKQFREQLPQPEDTQVAQGAPPPKFRLKDYYEVADEARAACLDEQAYDKAEWLLSEAKRHIAKAPGNSGKAGNSDSSEAYDSNGAQLGDYYGTIAAELSTESVQVVYGQSEYLSQVSAQRFMEFGTTYKTRRKQPERALLDILFNCEPLLRRLATRLDEPPVQLHEDIGPVVTFDYNRQPTALLLVRIVGVDSEREAVSLDDDGRQGPAEALSDAKLGPSTLRQDVLEDWKNLQALELAKQHAGEFAREAKQNWSDTLAATNESLTNESLSAEPNQVAGMPGPLTEKTLDQVRQQLEQFRQYAANQNAPYFRAKIKEMTELLGQAAELARQQSETDQQELPVLVSERGFGCMVFGKLEIVPISQEDYLRRRPLNALRLMNRDQDILALIHFSPANIEKRVGYVEHTDPKTKAETESETESETKPETES